MNNREERYVKERTKPFLIFIAKEKTENENREWDKMNLIDLAALSEKRRDIILLIEKKPGSFEKIESYLA